MTTPKPTQYVLRVTRIHITPPGEAVFSERATSVEIVDEAAGEFVKIVQDRGDPEYRDSICINDEEEWNAISAAVADLFAEIKKHHTEEQP